MSQVLLSLSHTLRVHNTHARTSKGCMTHHTSHQDITQTHCECTHTTHQDVTSSHHATHLDVTHCEGISHNTQGSKSRDQDSHAYQTSHCADHWYSLKVNVLYDMLHDVIREPLCPGVFYGDHSV